VIMNLDTVTQLGSIIRITRYSEYGEVLSEVRYAESASAIRGTVVPAAGGEPAGLATVNRSIGFVEPATKPPTAPALAPGTRRQIGFVERPPVPTDAAPAGPGRTIGFVEPTAKPAAGGPRPGVGFAAQPRTEPPVTAPPGEQPFTQLPPTRQVTSVGETTPRTSASGGTRWRPIKDADLVKLRQRALTNRNAGMRLMEYEQAEAEHFNPVARAIAKGHAKAKHFPKTMETDDLTRMIEETMANKAVDPKFSEGRTAYWSNEHEMIVIEDPNTKDLGTAFKPNRGKAYFDDWPNVGEHPWD